MRWIALLIFAFLAAAPVAQAEDKRQIAVTSGVNPMRLRVLNPDGSVVRTLVERPSNNLAYPSWSQDEKTMAYFENGKVLLQPTAGGTETTLVAGYIPAFAPVGNEVAYWTGPLSNATLNAIPASGGASRVIAGPFAGIDGFPPAWSPDGKKLAFGMGGSIVSVPATGGGSPTTVATPGADGRLNRPAYAPDGKRIAYVHDYPAQAQTAIPDRLVVRDLASGTENVVLDHPGGGVQMDSTSTPSWSADSDRIAFAEVDLGVSPDNYRLATVKADGTGGRQNLVTGTEPITSLAWANAPRLPSYYVSHVEVTQAISPDLGPLLPFDPLLADPYTIHWSEPTAFGFPIPLIAEKSSLMRIYVGDATLPAGTSSRRSLQFSVVDAGTAVTYASSRPQDVDVTAPGVAPDQDTERAALNVWLPPEAGKPAGKHGFEVEVNSGQAEAECAGCYPNGNRASVQDVRYDEGGSVVLAPVPIYEILPTSRTVLEPDAKALESAIEGGIPMLPIRDDGVTVARSPGSVMVEQRDLAFETGCDVLFVRLLEFRSTNGVAGPVAGFGATRWVGYAPPVGAPPGVKYCAGRATGPNLVLLGPEPDTLVHEFGHTLGLTHVTGRNLANPPAGATPLPYAGIGGVGYRSGPGGVTEILRSATTGDVMSYDQDVWTSPKTWRSMWERILAESGAVRPSAGPARARAAAAVKAPRVRRLVSGIVRGPRAVILNSVVAEAQDVAEPGALAARVVAKDARGKTVATAAVRGTPEQEEGQSGPSLPFVVTLPDKKRIASLEVLPSGAGKPLARLRASKHAPKGRLLKLPKRVPATTVLMLRRSATDRDRRDKLSVDVLVRRGNQKWRSAVLGPAKGSIAVDPRTLGSGKTMSVRLRVTDGFRTIVTKARRIVLR